MIPIFKPYMPKEVESGLAEILYSGKLSFGKYGKMFEKEVKNYISNDLFISISSYNQAILIALSTLGIINGDEIIASPVSCLASNQPFVVRGVKVVWADVNPSTGTLDVDDVKRRITKKTKAIFLNHYCGYAGNIDEISALAKEKGIYFVEDCVEAFGTIYNGKRIGNTGADVSIFSFQTVRLPNTIDGGGLSFKDKELYNKASKIRDYGIDRAKFRDEMNEINPNCDIKLEGYGALLSEVNSYIGLRQFEKLDQLLEIQRSNALQWKNRLIDSKDIKVVEAIDKVVPNYWVFGVFVENKGEKIQEFRNNGFYATGVHINNNIYSVFDNSIELKGVSEFINSFIALPCGWWLNMLNKKNER